MHSKREQCDGRSLKMAALHWDSIVRVARLLLAVVVAGGCHAEGPSSPTRPSVENGEIRREAKRREYAAFFKALKRQVAQSWDPVSVWRSVDPTGTVYGGRTRVTEVRVSLSRSGEVAKLMVTSPSGVTELDDEALRAFRTAGPFPPPPDGLLGHERTARKQEPRPLR